MVRTIRVDYRDVLREIQLSEERIPVSIRRIAKIFGYRPYMVQRYVDMLGLEEAYKLLQAFERRPPPAIRCNTLKIDCESLTKRLERLGFGPKPVEWCKDYCFRVVKTPTSPSLGATHEYFKGFYYVYRDIAALLPPLLLDPHPNELVLDMAAAPGGKATHIAQLMKNRGFLVANDKAKTRLPALIENLMRLGIVNTVVTCFDARELPLKLRLRFDRVLLDAPCSAEGAIMFDPERKRKTSIEDLARLVAREIEMLYAAIEMAKNGGVIVYSTCSIAPEENEYVVNKVIDLRNDVEVIEPRLNVGSEGLTSFRELKFSKDVRKCLRLWPHRHGTEGFFICVLRRTRA